VAIVILHDILLATVIVELPVMVIKPVADHVVFATNVRLPARVIVPVEVKVNAPEVEVFILPAFKAPVSVTVPVPEPLSNITVSAVVGTVPVPPGPPDIKDQCVVEAVSQVPVPPTQ
jgi:hypothetical protein